MLDFGGAGGVAMVSCVSGLQALFGESSPCDLQLLPCGEIAATGVSVSSCHYTAALVSQRFILKQL